MELPRRVALVTGAGRGIGAAAALALARGGILPVLTDVAELSQVEPLLERIAAALAGSDAAAGSPTDRAPGAAVEPAYHRMDVSRSGDVASTVNEIAGRYGRIDILVNNAGILSTTPLADIAEAEWDRVMGVNLKGAFLTTQAVVPIMRRRRFGRVINIASMAGRMGGISVGAAYAVSKSGLIGLTWNLARALAADGITVNAVAPGPVEGAMYDGFTDDQRATLERSIPVGRLGTPEEIGAAVAFLASDQAGFMNGTVIDANGGAFTG